jgi:serine/threonine protein kinase
MTLLYELSDDRQAALNAVLGAYQPRFRSKARALKKLDYDIRGLLRDEGPEARLAARRIWNLYSALDSLPNLQGALGGYLFLYIITTAAQKRSRAPRDYEALAGLLSDPPVAAWIRSFYGLDDGQYDFSAVRLHEIGTTSFILWCRRQPADDTDDARELAVKCLLPRYMDLRSIRERTLHYARDHSVPDDVGPQVHSATYTTVTMDFVDGDTLASRLAARAVSPDLDKKEHNQRRVLDRADLQFLRELATVLCFLLKKLAKSGKYHLDLSPTNIIVVSQPNQPLRLKLVDFGPNFILTERAGSSSAFGQAALYVSPELLNDPDQKSWRCDIYSLGMILLEAASKQSLQLDGSVAELTRLWQGTETWDGAAGLARLIEEMIDSDPAHRLLLQPQPQDDPVLAYTHLEQLIAQETDVMEEYETRSGTSGLGVFRGPALLRFWRNPQFANIFAAGRRPDASTDAIYQEFPRLARWTAASLTGWAMTLLAFASFTIADFGVPGLTPAINEWAHFVPLKAPDFWPNLPGRLVSLTFGMAAVTYYVNGFSTVAPRVMGSWLGRASDAAMRATAVGLWAPILWAICINPEDWALCAGIGTLLVVLNNYLALRIANRANAVAANRHFSTMGDTGWRFVDDVFREWWKLMGGYSGALLVVGVLLAIHRVHGVWLFAVFVVAINIIKMYRLNCTQQAPRVRGSLDRDILTLRRASHVSPPEPSAPEGPRSVVATLEAHAA